MKEMKISSFKAKCLAVMAQVAKTGNPVLITRYGKPVARIEPPPKQQHSDWIGSMKGTGRILGDIVRPISDLDDWDWEAPR